MQLPGFPGGFDLNEMMRQAMEMQDKIRREMEDIRVEASSGGGMVTVSMNGAKLMLSAEIDPVALDDREMLQDMFVAAVNEATRKVDEKLKARLGGMLPPGFGG
jgi:hypothetical protein